MTNGQIVVEHGMKTYFLTDKEGKVKDTYSISAGLDYPGVGPEHAYLKESNRAEFRAVTDKEAVEAFTLLSKTEGIIPALESSHAVAHAIKMVPEMDRKQIVVINLSRRGDKDVEQIAEFWKKSNNKNTIMDTS